MLAKALMPLAERLDRKFGWQRLPYYVGLATLVGLRERLRERNLYEHGRPGRERPQPPGAREARRPDGQLQRPRAARDGHGRRAVRAQRARRCPDPDPLAAPRPRDVSDALMDRDAVPARARTSTCSPPRGCSSRSTTGSATPRSRRSATGCSTRTCRCRRRSRRPARTRRASSAARPHWWDASQLYGTHEPYIDRRSRRRRRDRRRRRPAASQLERAGRELQRARGEPVGRPRARC